MALESEVLTLDAAKQALELIRQEVSRLEQRLAQQLRPNLSAAQSEAVRLRTQREGLVSALSGLSEARQEATEQVRTITKRQLAEIKQLTGRPPESIKRTLVAAWILLHGDRFRGKPNVTFDEGKDWPRCQRMLADEGFVAMILNFDTALLDEVPHVPRHVAERFFGMTADSGSRPSSRSGNTGGDTLLATAAAAAASAASGSSSQRRRTSQNGEIVSAASAPAIGRNRSSTTSSSSALQRSGTSVTVPQMSPHRRGSAGATLDKPLELSAVMRASTPCGALFRWMLELLREHLERERIRKELQLTDASLAMADAESVRLESDVVETQACLEKAQKAAEDRERALALLQAEHDQAKKAVQDLKKLEALAQAPPPSKPDTPPSRRAKRREPKPRPIELELSGSMAHIQNQASGLRVKFDKGSTGVLGGDGQQACVLPKIADMVKEHKGRVKFLLEGHRDPEERDGVDLERCRAVFDWLVEGALCSPGGIRIKGRGSFCGEGRCVVPLPIEELTVTSGPLSREVEAASDSAKPGLYFEASEKSLTNESKAILTKMAEWLDVEDDARVRIEGHTDLNEPPELGVARAQAVQQHLVTLGVGEGRLRPQGCGARHPASRLHAALNRRVEVHVE